MEQMPVWLRRVFPVLSPKMIIKMIVPVGVLRDEMQATKKGGEKI
jgi:hypothetical protein